MDKLHPPPAPGKKTNKNKQMALSVCDVTCMYIWREIIDKSPDTIWVSSNGMIHCKVPHSLTL